MPVYKYNGTTYDIPEDVVSDFEKDMPEATLAYQVDGTVYDIPVSEKKGFLDTYPNASLYGEEVAQPTPSAGEQLQAFYQENGAFLDDFEKRDTADSKLSAVESIDGGFSLFGAKKNNSLVTDEERKQYDALDAQRKQLEKAWYTSDEYLSQKNATALELGQMRDDIHNSKKAYVESQPQIKMSGLENAVMEGKTIGDYESQQFDIAARIMDKTIKLHNAPSKYDSNSGLKNMGIGAADKATDPALLSAGLTEITDNVGARVVLQKVQKELGNLNDLSEERIEKILSPAEKAVLRSWARYAQEQLNRQGDLSLGYQAGQGAVESLAFMAEFALTGGVGKAASEGAETLAKWLGKKWYTGVKGLGDEAAEAVMKAAGEKTLGKYGQKLGLALAETAGRTLVMPSTYRNISEKATEIEEDEDGNRYLIGLNDAFIKGYADSFIENLSEGGRVNALGELVGDIAGKIPAWKKMVDVFSNTKASELLKRLNSTGIMNTLRAGGWHGLGEEYLEEWYGNALRTITGVDKNALKNFVALDNQMVTLASFLPISIFGGTVSTGQVISAKRDLDKKAKALQSALMGRGYDGAQAKNMIDMMRAETPQGISNLITPLIRRVAGANENEARELAKPAMEFAWAVRRYQSYDTKYSYQQQEQRDNLKADMEAKLGKFWMEGEDGQQKVQRGVNEKGEVVYLLGKKDIEETAEGIGAEKEVAAIDAEGNHIFVFPSDYRLEEELPMNDFLGIEIMTQKRDSEAVRMASERDAKFAEVKSRSRLGTQLNIGTNEAPVVATISKVDADGVVVETPEGFRKITYTDLANKYADINPAVYTDAELDEQEADNISAERAQREAALDQEYENDDDAIEELAEAENEIEQSVEEATKLPLKDDGTVDQAALWNESPARWAKWNDEQKQDGGADTLAYLNTAIKAQTAKIEQLVAAQEAETDFDRRDAIAAELSEARMRQGDLLALHGQYTTQVEAQAIQQQAAQPVQPAPQLTEEEKAALEEERRKPLRAKAKELSEKLGVKVKIAEDLSDVKESKAREQLLKSVVSNGKQKVAGWYNQATGEVTIYLPHAKSVEDVEKTFIHEVVAHKGLRGLLGEEGFNVLCDAVWDMMSEGDRMRFINYPGVNGDKRAAADEYMAHFAENLNLEEAKPDMWERIVAIIKQILDSMGVRLRINQEGLSSVIAASYQKLVADAKAAQGVSAEAVTETATETIAEEPQTGGAEEVSEERESFRVVNKQEDPNGVTPEQIDEINRSVGGELEVGEDDAPVRFSVTAIGEGAGLEILKDDGDGNVAFVLPDGRRFNANNLLKPEDIKSLPNTVLGYMMKDAKSLGNVDTAKELMLWNKYTLMLNAILLKGSAENGGFDTLSSQWQWIGDTIYKTVGINSDSLYSFSLDITRVCKKNEAVINAIAEMQARLGYGITPGQIMDIYLTTSEEGYQVPCPVCYVFSRYIRNGKYATIMINGQRKYGNELVDPNSLTPKQKEKKVKFWLDELAKIKAENNEHSKEIAKANSDITTLLDEIDKIAKELTNPQNNFTEEEKAQMMSKIYELDARYKAALNVVSQASLDSWITQFAIHKVKIDGKEQWTLYEDSYMGFPEEMALDLRQTSTVMRKYPAIQRFRNSRGAAAGKEITFVANNDLGDVPLALGSSAATKDLARPRDMSDEEWEEIQGKEYADLKLGVKNLYQQAVEEKDPKKKAALLKKAKTRFTSASIYAKQQSLRGGQRMWSWSDNIERLAPDVFVNLLQLEMLGGALQSYSKQLEGIKLVASMNGYVNGSLMGKGNGYREVMAEQTEEVDGQLYLKDGDFVVAEPGKKPFILKTPVYQHTDGKLYVLEFDDVVGIDPFGKDVDGKHMKGLFELNAEYDRAGNIIVGMNDLHIRMCMADDRIFFIIPWHSSGANTHILAQMYEYLGVEYDVTLSQDYTDVQSEKRYKAPTEAEEEADSAAEGEATEEGDEKKESNKISQFLVDFWNDHYENAREYAGYGAVAGKDFACGIKGGVEPSDGNGNLSASQMHYRELRDAIFLGVKVPIGVDKNGKPKTKAISVEEYSEEWFNEIMNDAFLSQVYTKVRALMGDKGMTSADTKAIYPYEYWDESSTYATADINGARYVEYCRRLGYKPKFCGKLDGKPESDHGNFTDDKGYWKVLIDRRMYAISGRFQDLTPVTADNFTPDLVDPEVTKEEFIVTRVADEAGTQTIVDKAIAREESRPGGIAKVDYDMTLSDALNVYNNGDVRMRASAPSGVIDLVEEAKKAVAREEAKDNVSFRITPEMKEIKEKTQADGTFMKAPNGQPTNLTEEQWLMVRTENFKEWFGDWENDPENASKVVDENGEPKVVYHQTNQKIYVNRETGENWDELGWKEKMEWDERDDWEDYWEEQDFNTFSRVNARTTNEFDGFFFAPEYDEYHEYGDRTIAAFVNIKNPASREDYNIDSRYNDAGRNERIRLQEAGFDGVIRMDGDNVDEYIAFEPNQIKSATDNNGDFNPNNNDIRFRMREEGESAMDFHQSVVDEFSSAFNPVAEIQVYPVNEETAKKLGYTLEELQETYGDYDKENDIISIFAHEDVTNSIDVESTIFHESIHKNQAHFGGFTKIGDWMLDMAEINDVFAEYREIVRENYTEDKHSEEMLCLMLGDLMALRRAFEFMAMMPEDIQGICEDLLNQLDYDKSKEKDARVLGLVEGRSDSSTTIPAKRKASKGSWRKTEAKAALTAEERRIIGEYFPEFNKSEDVRMRVNSQGKELTEGQREFFANSKAVDKDGNLLVLYHGTPRAGFAEFKSGWFTTSKEDAISYSGDRKGRLFDPNEEYVPETLTAGDYRLGYMTFDSEEDRAEFLERFPYADEVMSERDYENARMEAEDEEYDALTARRKEFAEVWNAYREYERDRFVDTTVGDLIANPEAYTEEDLMRAMLEYDSNATFDSLDDMSTEERKDALVSALQTANEETDGGILNMAVPTRVPRNGEGVKHNDLGNRTYEVYANVENPYEIDAKGRGSEFESGDVYKAVEDALADEQYDGVIIRNWRVGRSQQLGDVVVPKNGSQIKLTSNENPTESSDIRFRTSLELDNEFGDAWRNQQNEDGRHSTQVANTKSTYEKIGHYLEDAGMKGASILDASSGLGLGTQALREMGFQVDDVEPFPSENREAPTFSSYADIDGQYDVVISNAVLNVIPDDWRADVLHQMADAVKEGGKMIINTRLASNIAQQGVEGKTRITLDSPSEILVKRGDRIAAYQKGFTSEELAEWIKSELGEGWRVEKATKKNSGISGEGTAVVIKDGDNVSFRTTGTPTDEVVANGVDLTPSQTSEVAANIFAALPEESRKKITEGLNGNILGLKDAILQIPASLASKENWNDEDRAMADIVADEMTKAVGKDMTRPFSAPEALWLLYNNLNKSTDLVSLAQRSLVQRNLGFDAQTLATENEAKESLRFRQVGDARINATASLYNKGAVNVMTRLKESFVDMNASVEELVKAIEERTGKKADGFENILWALNQQSSRGLAAMEDYERRFLNPMYDAIRNIMDKGGFKYEDVVRYVILKHGLERNKKLAQRDAKAHYQEIYDEIIEKINSMDDRQKRTYLTNAQLKEADAKAKLATLQAKDTSTLTEDEMKDHKKELAVARKEVKDAEEYRERAEKIRNMSEQEAKDELDKIFEKIENGTDSIYKELRESDYSGLTSMFYDQLGVDRNLFATEEAYQSALMSAKEDKYSSLEEVEAAAEAEVKKFEGAVDTKELWKRVNAATKETLRQQYEANMISKDQYLNLRDMFEYYVPLRGFKDNTAEDMYTYYRKPNSTGYTKPILGAEGRKTEAESPFGWIASMAGSAIASNVKNEAKLALFYFVSNRPENGIATISKTWYVDSGEVDERGKKIFKPAYPPFSEDLSSAEGKAQYEIWQANMKELQKKGQAYEAGQRLNLGNAVVNISDANKPEHIVSVKVGGKDYTIIINGNPRAAQAINGELNLEGTADDYSALFGPVLRWMSSVNTSYNPEFWITNMMRDMAFTWMAVNTKGADDKEYRRKFSKNYRKAFKVISLVAKNENGTIGDSYLEEQYKDFVKYGGVTGYTQIKDSETWEKEIEQYLRSNDPESLKSGKMMRGMKTVFHAAHRFGESLEQVSRFAAFLTAQEMGKSINEAINDAKEITVNFNRKGSGKMISLEEAKHLTDKNGRPLSKPKQWMVVGLSSIAPLGRRFIMFFNAAIQGLNATYKLWKANPKRFKGWVMGYFAVGAMNAILHAMMDDDDDYLDMPQYERRNALMIGGNGAYLKWALPQEAKAFYALGDIVVESMLGRNPQKFWQKGGEVGQILTTIGEVLPINPTEGWRAFAPSIAIPALELMINEDYKGEAIYNDSKWLSKEEASRTANWNTAKSGTGWVHVKIAQGLNFLTGGDKYDAGLINIRPEAIEHLVQSAFGGTIRTADKFITTISAAIDPEEDVTVNQTPFLNRVLTLNDQRYRNVHVNEVFDYYAAEAEHAKTLEKKYREDGDSDALLDLTSSDEYKWMMIYENYKKPLENVRERLKVAEGTRERKQIMREQDELKKMMIKQISNL